MIRFSQIAHKNNLLFLKHCRTGQSKMYNSTVSRMRQVVEKGRGKKWGCKKDVVDLRTLLSLCTRAVAANDKRTHNEVA